MSADQPTRNSVARIGRAADPTASFTTLSRQHRFREASLVAFTLLSQTAVGTFVVLAIVHLAAAARAGTPAAWAFTIRAWPAVSAMALLGLAASLFHLGSMANAWRAGANLRTSWLSREIVCALLFAASSILLAGSGLLFAGSGLLFAGSSSLLAAAGVACGFGLVYSMARAYRVRTIAAWDTPITTASFFTTTALLGCLAALLLLALTSGRDPMRAARPILPWVATAAIPLLILRQFLHRKWLARLETGDSSRHDARGGVSKDHRRLHRLLLTFAAAGLVFVAFSAILAFAPRRPITIPLLLGAFLPVLISELLGRVLFYRARVGGLRS